MPGQGAAGRASAGLLVNFYDIAHRATIGGGRDGLLDKSGGRAGRIFTRRNKRSLCKKT